MRVVFMGTPDFAVSPLEHLIHNGYEVAAVYTQPDRPAGRGRELASSPVSRAARGLGLTVVQPPNLKGAGVVAQLAGFAPDAIVVAAFGQLLPQRVLDIPRYGCLNIHPSLLPRFRGASPVAAAILAGDEFTGVTIMLMDKGLDTGPVLAQAQIPVSASDTTGSLAARLSQIAARLLPDVLLRRVSEEVTPRPQNDAGASYAGELTREQGEIDWHLPAVALWRRVRAFQPWPGSYTRWRGRQLKILEAAPVPWTNGLDAGRVMALPQEDGPAGFAVGCGEGTITVSCVQPEGKRAMPAAEFVRGQRGFIGALLPD